MLMQMRYGLRTPGGTEYKINCQPNVIRQDNSVTDGSKYKNISQ